MMLKKILSLWLFWIVIFTQSSYAADVGKNNNDSIVPVISKLLLVNTPGVEIIRSIAEKYAVKGRSITDIADHLAVQSFIDTFPTGDSPLNVSGYGSSLNINITSQASAYFMIGVQAIAQDSRKVALWVFAEAAARNPNDPVYVNSLAFELIEFGYIGEAEILLRLVLQMAPAFAEAKVNLAFILGGKGRHKEAGDLYQQALLIEAGDAHSAYAAAREYLAAGEHGMAWLMAGLGQDIFPTEFDFTSLQSRINYPPDESGLQCQGLCISNDCMDVFNSWTIETIAWGKQTSDYRNNVYDPSMLAADQARYNHEQRALNHLRGCDNYYSPQFEICRCESWVQHDSASPNRFVSWYGTEALMQEVQHNNHKAQWREIWAYYEQQKHLLTVDEKSYLICFFESQQLSEERALYEERRAELGSHLSGLSNARYNLAVTTKFYCQDSIFYDWFFTLEYIESFEPKACAGPICFSKDTGSGDYGTEINAGLSYKLTRNPHTGKGTMSIGIGKSIGVNSFNFGGAVQATVGGGKIGLIGKASLGWYDTGVFVGVKHQRTNWSSYP